MRSEQLPAAEALVWHLAAALRGAQLYSPGHPLIARNVTTLSGTLRRLHESMPSVAVGVVGDEFVVGSVTVPRAAETMHDLRRLLDRLGIERVVVDRGVTDGELTALVAAIAKARQPDQLAELGELPHVRVGRLEGAHHTAPASGEMATFRQLYDDAVRVAGDLWDSASVEGQPDADAAREMVDSLAQAVAQNRTALLSLTALKDYDDYTFTHMVNVSILTMGQARGVGIDGPRLREFGLAALMHDIGKVRTPKEILNKPDKLTDEEFTILKRHAVDGATILRQTPEMPTLAPIVAFEHHLRADGTGYPAARRPTLNLGTTLCGIADVYDAMRSQRVYQPAFPTDRILAVLQRNDGTQFDQHLVRRFVQLVGIYPVGNLVRLDSGEVAVVLQPYPPDPYRPRIRVLLTSAGVPLSEPIEVNLWEAHETDSRVIQAPVDPAAYGIDPLAHL